MHRADVWPSKYAKHAARRHLSLAGVSKRACMAPFCFFPFLANAACAAAVCWRPAWRGHCHALPARGGTRIPCAVRACCVLRFLISCTSPTTLPVSRVSRVHCASENYEMNLQIDINLQLYPLLEQDRFTLVMVRRPLSPGILLCLDSRLPAHGCCFWRASACQARACASCGSHAAGGTAVWARGHGACILEVRGGAHGPLVSRRAAPWVPPPPPNQAHPGRASPFQAAQPLTHFPLDMLRLV